MNDRDERDIVTLRIEDEINTIHQISMGASSIIGTRESQQDSLYLQHVQESAIAIVCDGMGGMEGGELASQTAVRMLAEDFEEELEENIPEFYRKEAVKMDTAVARLSGESGKPMHAGTTIVSIIIIEDKLYWLSVGDSRIYIFRGNEFVQVNQEHNYKMYLDLELQAGRISEQEYQERIAKGDALISYLGIGNLSLMDINPVPFRLQGGDTILLCSDGLYKRLDDTEILEIIKCGLPDVEEAAHELTRVVMEKTFGSQDNTSVILIQYNQYLNNTNKGGYSNEFKKM